MARKTVTLEEVVDAQAQLRAQGMLPSVRAIHRWIGHGSFTTILSLMGSADDAKASALKAKVEIPNALLDEIQRFVAENVLKAIIERNENHATLEQTCTELAEANSDLNQRVEEQHAEISDLQGHKSQSLGQIEQLRDECHAAKRDMEREREISKSLLNDLTLARLKVEGLPNLEAQLAQTRDDAQSCNARRIELEKDCATLEVRNQGLVKSETSLQTRIGEMEHQIGVLQDQLRACSTDLSHARVAIATSRGELALAHERLRHAEHPGIEPAAMDTSASYPKAE